MSGSSSAAICCCTDRIAAVTLSAGWPASMTRVKTSAASSLPQRMSFCRHSRLAKAPKWLSVSPRQLVLGRFADVACRLGADADEADEVALAGVGEIVDRQQEHVPQRVAAEDRGKGRRGCGAGELGVELVADRGRVRTNFAETCLQLRARQLERLGDPGLEVGVAPSGERLQRGGAHVVRVVELAPEDLLHAVELGPE